LGAGGFTFPGVLLGSFKRLLFRHVISLLESRMLRE
jgi:hypothetical protein